MRCHKVTVTHMGQEDVTYAGTSADAREAKRKLIEERGVKRNQVEIEQVEVPLAKADLIEWLNKHAVPQAYRKDGE